MVDSRKKLRDRGPGESIGNLLETDLVISEIIDWEEGVRDIEVGIGDLLRDDELIACEFDRGDISELFVPRGESEKDKRARTSPMDGDQDN